MYLKCGRVIAAVLCVCLAGFSGSAWAQSKKLPLDAFAMEPAIENVRVSPDGKHIAMLMLPHKGAKPVLTIYRTDNLGKDPLRIGSGKMRFIDFFWGSDERLVVELRQFIEIDHAVLSMTHKYAYRLASVDVTGRDWVHLPDRNFRTDDTNMKTYMEIAPASVLSRLPDDDEHILIAFDGDGNFVRDIYKININNGSKSRIVRGRSRLGGYLADRNGDLRFASSFDPAKFEVIFHMREGNGEVWNEIHRFGVDDKESFEILGDYLPDPDKILVAANNGHDRVGLWEFNVKTKKIGKLVFRHPEVDVAGVVNSTKPGEEDKLAGYLYVKDVPNIEWVDAEEKALHDRIDEALPGRYNEIRSRSRDGRYMVIRSRSPKDAGTYYLLTDQKQLSVLGPRYPLLPPGLMGKVEMIRYKTRDGLEIPAYLTTPAQGKPPYPGIVMPHGGPWARDNMLFDIWTQFLAHHGYAVLQPQFRGSTGFGIKLWRAGDAQWGLAMQDDLEDGMLHLVSKGIVDRNRMAIFGWSYGGYAAMVAATRSPNIFQCAIPGAGVSDISELRAGLGGSRILRVIQRPTIKGVSPLEKVANVNIPVLVIHGDEDERVDIEHSRKFVDGLKRHNKPHKFVVLEGANHFFGTIYYEHFKKMYGEMLKFLKNDCGPGGL